MESVEKNKSSVFRFKRFEVDQRDCPMKINTDGVLLGAMAGRDGFLTNKNEVGSVLDIGTGTGVIALMLAQRYPHAEVHGIEIDAAGAQRAKINFKDSPFSDRLTATQVALEEFESVASTYDLIVSNPPFFMDSLKNPDQRKRVARHADRAFFVTLLRTAATYLRPEGTLQLIIPYGMLDFLIQEATHYALVEAGRTEIYSFAEDEKPIRVILTWIRKTAMERKPTHATFIIYAARGQYSLDYQMLLKDFFLDF